MIPEGTAKLEKLAIQASKNCRKLTRTHHTIEDEFVNATQK